MLARDAERRTWPYSAGFALCLAAGLVLGVAFSSVAVVTYLVSGPGPFEVLEISFGASIAGYLGAFLAAGLVAGVLNPLGRTKAGAVLLGILATFPLAVTALFLLEGTLVPHEGAHVSLLVFYPVGFGGPVGYLMWREFVAPRKR